MARRSSRTANLNVGVRGSLTTTGLARLSLHSYLRLRCVGDRPWFCRVTRLPRGEGYLGSPGLRLQLVAFLCEQCRHMSMSCRGGEESWSAPCPGCGGRGSAGDNSYRPCTVPTGRASRKAGRGRAMSCLVRVGCDMSGLSFWALHRRLGTAPWGRVVCMPVDRTLAEAMSTTAQCHPDKFNRK